jgi:hypothetical protein
VKTVQSVSLTLLLRLFNIVALFARFPIDEVPPISPRNVSFPT